MRTQLSWSSPQSSVVHLSPRQLHAAVQAAAASGDSPRDSLCDSDEQGSTSPAAAAAAAALVAGTGWMPPPELSELFTATPDEVRPLLFTPVLIR